MQNQQSKLPLKQQQQSLTNQINHQLQYQQQSKQQNKQSNIERLRPKISQQPKKKKKLHLSFQPEQQQSESYKIVKNPLVNKQNQSLKIQQSRKSSTVQNLQQIIKAQYIQKIQKLKQQLIQIQYRYWEGGQMIKKLRRKKKQKIIDILDVCRLQLVSSFKQLVQLKADDLLFVMKDFIVPHQMALYQIEALQLKTKKNQLIMNLRNAKIKKQGKQLILSVNIDGPVKIIQKSKYQKNKLIYPFSNWQTLKITTNK